MLVFYPFYGNSLKMFRRHFPFLVLTSVIIYIVTTVTFLIKARHNSLSYTYVVKRAQHVALIDEAIIRFYHRNCFSLVIR